MGPDDATECMVFSHGFGVGRDSRGMFTDLVEQLSDKYLCILFEYTRVESDATHVDSYQTMLWTLMRVIEHVQEQYAPRSIHLVAHSMGCLLAASQSIQFHKQIYLAPATEPLSERLKNHFKQNPNTVIDALGNVSAKRSDGSTTQISRRFFDELQPVIPMDQYAMTNGEVMVVEAAEDEIVTNHTQQWGVFGNISVMSISGDHNFKPPYRAQLVQTVLDYFEHE